jgi:hypothetical protein
MGRAGSVQNLNWKILRENPACDAWQKYEENVKMDFKIKRV